MLTLTCSSAAIIIGLSPTDFFRFYYHFIIKAFFHYVQARLLNHEHGLVPIRDTPTRVQIRDKADCISYSINNLGKGMNPSSYGGHAWVFNLTMATGLGEWKL